MSVPLLLLVVAAVVAVVDWWAVAVDRREIERVAKPAVMLALAVVAATLGDAPADVRAWLMVGVLFGLVGDVALLDDGETRFLVGLAAFAVGHLAYGLAGLSLGFDLAWAVPGALAVSCLLAWRFATRTLPGAHRSGGPILGGAVVFYATVISFMVVTAWATGTPPAALGALLFALSDWVLGHRRFVGELPGGRLSVMVPYHMGQGLLVAGLATA